ncbi:hypothetical protein [Seinonella peptonophila]|uniref:hypothetical protein n=1 Tax=Seinonella peptonophila TaxID=112248 RepID=UPI001114BB4D|nr:hypothetical protein [Seinonella peptonophila]
MGNTPTKTFELVLRFAKSKIKIEETTFDLTDEVKNELISAWGQRPVTEFSNMDVFDLAGELASVLPDNADKGYNNDFRFDLAEAISVLLAKGLRSNDVQPQQPQKIEVKVEETKTPDKMFLPELLAALVKDNYADLRPFIEDHCQVQTAVNKAKDGAWVIPGSEAGTIDVEQTMWYVNHLAERDTYWQREVDGRRPVTLQQALGIESRSYFNPFTKSGVKGPWEGYDFSQLDENLHEALVWASTISHKAWPKVIDEYTHLPEVFAKTLAPRWQEIFDDYIYKVQTGQISRVSRYWTEDNATGSNDWTGFNPRGYTSRNYASDGGFYDSPSNLGGTTIDQFLRRGDMSMRNPGSSEPRIYPVEPRGNMTHITNVFGNVGSISSSNNVGSTGSSSNSDEFYRRELMDAAADRLSRSGSDSKFSGLCRRISVNGSDNAFNVIVLEGGSINGSDNNGTIYVPRRVSVRINGSDNNVDEKTVSWERLYQIAQENGYLD